ncbi:MAG: DUF1289 domain-containing protein [Proteobacteria bacterium]|nr:DUF1289 domain-containing protein [Pseudomonadota bacterium]
MPDSDAVPSPCIDVCRMDADTGWCRGCLRTIDEIAAWASLDAPAKRAVRDELGKRRTQLGAQPPWPAEGSPQ